MGSFSDKVRGFGDRGLNEASRRFDAIGTALFRSIILDTPVGNVDDWNMSDREKAYIRSTGYIGGTLRNDWRFGLNREITQKRDVVNKDGADALADMQSTLSGAKGKIATGKDSFVQANNNQPYANRIEFFGWSKKADKGMVVKNVKRIAANVRSKGYA